jgi:hypothetical protein
MHESTQQAGFPNKGFGFRKAFAIVARNSIDTLVDKIAVSKPVDPLVFPTPRHQPSANLTFSPRDPQVYRPKSFRDPWHRFELQRPQLQK